MAKIQIVQNEDITNKSKTKAREKAIVKTSIIGILTNALLSIAKAIIGFLSGSIAITMDAVNNLSDAMSSIITIIGTKLSNKQATKKHPFGFGRIEYLSTLVIGIIVLYAGITALVESIKGIFSNELPDYNTVSIIIVGVAVVVKIVLGLFFKKMGKMVNSDSLKASGIDAIMDSVISLATVIAAIIYISFGLSLESYLGCVISLLIIKSAFEMLRDTVSGILGERPDKELAQKIKAIALENDDVLGVYDIILQDFGPERINGTLHIEVSTTVSVERVDIIIRKITEEVYSKLNVLITAIGIYARNDSNINTEELENKIKAIVLNTEYVTQIHGLYINYLEKWLHFDIVVSFDSKNRVEVYKEVIKKVSMSIPDYQVLVTLDTDFSE